VTRALELGRVRNIVAPSVAKAARGAEFRRERFESSTEAPSLDARRGRVAEAPSLDVRRGRASPRRLDDDDPRRTSRKRCRTELA